MFVCVCSTCMYVCTKKSVWRLCLCALIRNDVPNWFILYANFLGEQRKMKIHNTTRMFDLITMSVHQKNSCRDYGFNYSDWRWNDSWYNELFSRVICVIQCWRMCVQCTSTIIVFSGRFSSHRPYLWFIIHLFLRNGLIGSKRIHAQLPSPKDESIICYIFFVCIKTPYFKQYIYSNQSIHKYLSYFFCCIRYIISSPFNMKYACGNINAYKNIIANDQFDFITIRKEKSCIMPRNSERMNEPSFWVSHTAID